MRALQREARKPTQRLQRVPTSAWDRRADSAAVKSRTASNGWLGASGLRQHLTDQGLGWSLGQTNSILTYK